MNRKRKKGKRLIFCIILLALAVAGISRFYKNGENPISSALSAAVLPLQQGASRAGYWVEDFFSATAEYQDLKKELADVKQQLAQMQAQQRSMDTMIAENKRLRKLLSFAQENETFSFACADIIAKKQTLDEVSITINKGTKHGSFLGACAITEDGVFIGTVTHVTDDTSVISCLLTPGAEIGATVHETGTVGILTGDIALVTQQRIKLSYLPCNSAVKQGDTVVTSGFGGMYPPNLVIGTVDTVQDDAAGLDCSAYIIPAVEIKTLRQVYLVTSFAP